MSSLIQLGGKAYCIKCGYGPIPGDPKCAQCGREAKSLNIDTLTESMAEELAHKLKVLNIPDEFLAVSWSKEIFWNNNSSRRNPSLDKFVNNLDTIHQHFVDGGLYNKSALIIAPTTYSKVTFVTSCMTHAVKNGFKVAPMLSTLEANRLLHLSCGHKYNYKVYGMDYDTFMDNDLVVLTVSKTEARFDAAGVIKEFLSIRGARGKITLIISEFSLDVIARFYGVENIKPLFVPRMEENLKRYPVLVEYSRNVEKNIEKEVSRLE